MEMTGNFTDVRVRNFALVCNTIITVFTYFVIRS